MYFSTVSIIMHLYGINKNNKKHHKCCQYQDIRMENGEKQGRLDKPGKFQLLKKKKKEREKKTVLMHMFRQQLPDFVAELKSKQRGQLRLQVQKADSGHQSWNLS
jgi:hypothetical protein